VLLPKPIDKISRLQSGEIAHRVIRYADILRPLLLKNALRHSSITVVTTKTAVKQADARWQDEIKSLHGGIATLERAAKKPADLAQALKRTDDALHKARMSLRASDAAAKKNASDRDEEVQTLKSRITVRERALKMQTATRGTNRHAIIPTRQPEPEGSPSGTAESAPADTLSITTA
jgi:hypothetical protein